MNESAPKEREVNATPEPFDREWYQELKGISGESDMYSLLDPIDKGEYRKQERKRFESNEIENPVLDYPKLKQEELQERDDKLAALKENIVGKDFSGDERMEIVQQVWRWKINEKLAGVRMLKAAEAGDMHRFQRYSEFIYGAPSMDIFLYSINVLREKIEQYKTSENLALQKAAQNLDSILPSGLPVPGVRQLPDENTFQFAKEYTMNELGGLIDLPQGQDEFTTQEIQTAFEAAITRAHLDGWKTVIDPNRPDMMVSGSKKIVSIPDGRTSTRKRLEELILHEIGTHAVRRKNGEQSKLLLLGDGLDRYMDDEGVTGLREQIIGDQIEDFTHLDRHLAISLAKGLDGEKRDFRGVYEIMKRYYVVEELSRGSSQGVAEQHAKDRAWARAVRTFRGTDCKTKGACFTKDIVYREGNADIWEVVRDNPQEMMRFNVGKYDPANPRHIMILDQLGITDADLAALER